MTYSNETEMYPDICKWLRGFLQDRHKQATIKVFDSSQRSLVRLIREKQLFNNLPSEWQSWDLKVDITGFIITEKKTDLAFVECKKNFLTLNHLSQLLGYSKVAKPKYSFLIAPQGISKNLISLLKTYNRLDILEYDSQKGNQSLSITLARWDIMTQNIDRMSIITNHYHQI